MSDASSVNRNSKRPGQSGSLVGVRLQPSDLEALDAWITMQGDGLSRPEAVRKLMRQAMAIKGK